jgi:PPOX class probable FMN-dependent enzyme
MVEQADKFSQFEGIISGLDEIRAITGEPMPSVLTKVLDRLDDVCTAIISRSPFVVLASANAEGYPDISPKGDPVGFVKILDEKHIAIPDRPGNRRVDTFRNLLENPYLAVIFIIPGKGETLRITGECRIVRDQALRESMAVKDRVPDFAIVVHVERVLIHCPKCVVRARLWEPEAWPDASGTADIVKAMMVHADITQEELIAQAEKADVTRLY